MDSELEAPIDLDDALRRLADVMTNYQGSIRHLLADQVLYGMAIDVRSHTEAVALLSGTSWRRAAWANARAAFESAIDLSLLVATEACYDFRAAQSRVYEIYEAAALGTRQPHDVSAPSIHVDPEFVVTTEARELDEVSPKQGDALRRAHQTFMARPHHGRLKTHWSGLPRREIYKAGQPDEGTQADDRASMLDFVWGRLSLESHSRPRASARDVEIDGDTMRLGAMEYDRTSPRNVGALAAEETINALVRRRGFFPV